MRLFGRSREYVVNPKGISKDSPQNEDPKELRRKSLAFGDERYWLPLEEILVEYVGAFGPFQIFVIIYVLVMVSPLIAFNATGHFLILLTPPHECGNDTIGSNNTIIIEDTMYDNQTDTIVTISNISNFENDIIFNYQLIYPTPVSEV